MMNVVANARSTWGDTMFCIGGNVNGIGARVGGVGRAIF